MDTLKLGDIYIISDPELGEVTFVVPFVDNGLKGKMLTLYKEELEILIPWLQSKVTKFEGE